MAATVTGILLTGNHAGRPSSGLQAGTLYSCTTHNLIYQTSDTGSTWATWGTLGAATTVATDTIWDTKGDIVAATGADAASKLAAGANDTILMADSGQSTGLKWVASQTPSTQAFGDSAAEGTADTYARGDHKHAMPASPAGSVLAVAKINNSTNYTTTSATQADTHSSVAITFTAPSSGNILVRAVVAVNMSAAVQNAFLGLREGTTDLVNGTVGTFAIQGIAASATEHQVAWEAYLTGVSAGSHTYKLAFAVNGGATFIVRSFAGAPITLSVFAAP